MTVPSLVVFGRSLSTALVATLLAAPLAAQSPPPVGPARPVLLDRAVPVPREAMVEEAATVRRDDARRRAPRFEYGILMMSHFGGVYRWAGPERTFTESKNPVDFLVSIGADPATRLRAGRTQEEIHAAILQQLGLDGWEVVTCQFIREQGTGNWSVANVTTCHLKRPLDLVP